MRTYILKGGNKVVLKSNFIKTIVILPIIMNFIPLKFAVKREANIKNGSYLCSYVQTTGEDLYARSEDNGIDDDIFFEHFYGKKPYDILSKDFSTDYIEPTGNKYFLTGKINYDSEGYSLAIQDWDIAYPVIRKGLNIIFRPREYLNIYDYNWIAVIKYYWGSLYERD